ncbi:transcription-repair coupling factor, partial [Synechococcus sp. AH-707-D15]|nr:transcription-repair coupling factor [Synechococcus sp. AH-707-D15]
MPLSSLVRLLQTSALSGELCERAERDQRLLMRGAGRAARALVASALARRMDQPLLVVVPTLEEAGRWTALLELMGWSRAQLYPTSEGSPYEPFDSTTEITWGQLQVLSELQTDRSKSDLAIVATERCLQPHLPPPLALAEHCRALKKGDVVDLEELSTYLSQLGYERVSTIDQEGTWSRRGDIVDVYPVSSELPVRLEFFGNELDKLREFDPASQRSLDAVDTLKLTPTGFSPLIAERLREQVPDDLDQLLNEAQITELLEGGTPEGMRRLMGLAWDAPASLLDYLP